PRAVGADTVARGAVDKAEPPLSGSATLPPRGARPRAGGVVAGGGVVIGGEWGAALAEAVVHGDQLVVDEEVDVPLVALDAVGGLADDLAPDQLEAHLGTPLADGLAVAGRHDGGLGRAAG